MAASMASSASNRYGLGQNNEINVTPFVDVMLVLLIIFMVAAPLATVSIELELPKAGAKPQPQPETPVFISLQKSGRLYIGDMETNLARLGADLKVQIPIRNLERERVFIRADAEVPYEAFMRVMNKLQEHGFYSVALVGEDETSRT